MMDKLSIEDEFFQDSGGIHDIISKLSKDIDTQKQKLLFERIAKRVKVDEPLDITKEWQRRFPRICREYNSVDQSEHYYWNDGSIEGLHLISFYFDWGKDSILDNKINIGFTYR